MRNSKGQFIKGNKHTERIIKKISKALKNRYKEGKKFGFQKGNKGFRTPESYKQTGKKLSKIMKGKPQPWHKGKPSGMLGKHHSKEWKRKLSERMKGNRWNKGKKRSEEFKKKVSLSLKGIKHLPHQYFPKGHSKYPISPEKEILRREKIKKWQINNPNKIFKNTSIELKIEKELKKRNINYQKQVPLCNIAIVDFYLPEYRIVIQCDGDYWHNRPKTKENDEKQDKVLIFNGFNVYRFWQHEINESAEKCINKIIWKKNT